MKNSIIIFRQGSLGDTVISLPVFEEIKRRYPDKDLVLLTAYRNNPEIIPTEKILIRANLIKKVIKYREGVRSISDLFKVIKEIRKERICKCFYLMPRKRKRDVVRDAVFLRACGIREIIGLPLTDRDLHCQDIGNGLVEFEGNRLYRAVFSTDMPQDSGQTPLFEVSDLEYVLNIIRRSNFNSDKLVVVSVNSKMTTKNWSLQAWQKVLLEISTRHERYICFVGGASDADFVEQVVQALPDSYLNFCGQLSLEQSAALISLCELFIGVDSGPMHIANYLHKPLIGLFSARDVPGKWYPQGEEAHILQGEAECCKCMLEYNCPNHNICMESISPSMLIEKIQSLLKVELS